jgi:hypothetical protein
MLSLPVILLFALFGILATRYYLEWNTARWEAVEDLMQSGVVPANIDGGHEFNGWYGAKMDLAGRWDTTRHEYVVSFMPLEGYQVVERIEFKNQGVFPVKSLLVNKRPSE